MTEQTSAARVELGIPADDLILPFQAEHADVSGRLVKLGPVVDTILSRHDYQETVSQLLGEAVALTALLGAALKFEGKFMLHASTDGPVDLLVLLDLARLGSRSGSAIREPGFGKPSLKARDRCLVDQVDDAEQHSEDPWTSAFCTCSTTSLCGRVRGHFRALGSRS